MTGLAGCTEAGGSGPEAQDRDVDDCLELAEHESVESAHYGEWTAVEFYPEDETVVIWWSMTVDQADDLIWEDGDVIERDGASFDVDIQDDLVLSAKTDAHHYELGDEVRYQRNGWTVDALTDETARLRWNGGPDHVHYTPFATGDDIEIAGSTRYLTVDEDTVFLCPDQQTA